MPGVKDAFIVEGTENLNGLRPGVAIVANSTWNAIRARKKLVVQWDEGEGANHSWSGFLAQAQAASKQPGHVTQRRDGDVETALAGAARTVEAAYVYPFISHASMEPQNCTAWSTRRTAASSCGRRPRIRARARPWWPAPSISRKRRSRCTSPAAAAASGAGCPRTSSSMRSPSRKRSRRRSS
jgi:hypothetical protein